RPEWPAILSARNRPARARAESTADGAAMRRACRRDSNEHALVQLCRRLGAQWVEVGPLDGWLLWRGVWLPVEIKHPKREGLTHEYTPYQHRFFAFCRESGGRWLVWRTDADVLRDLGARVAA